MFDPHQISSLSTYIIKMDNFTETDIEFWKDLEAPQSDAFYPRQKSPLNSKIQKFKTSNPNQKEKFEKLLNQARQAFKQRYKDKLKLMLHKQSKYYEQKIEDIQELHRSEVTDLVKKFWSLDDTLINKDIQISNLQKFFIGQECDLAFSRISSKKTQKKAKLDLNDLITNEKCVFDQQIAAFKELLSVYERDLHCLKEQIADKEEEILRISKEHELELLEMKKKVEKTQIDCKKKIRDVNQKYLAFRGDVGTEFELKDTIIKKQGENLVRLKDELKLAKMVLDTPRLLFKYNMKEPYRNRQAKSLADRPLRREFHSKAVLRGKRFDSNETLLSTKATPLFTMTPEPEYSASVLPTLSEVDYYKY